MAQQIDPREIIAREAYERGKADGIEAAAKLVAKRDTYGAFGNLAADIRALKPETKP